MPKKDKGSNSKPAYPVQPAYPVSQPVNHPLTSATAEYGGGPAANVNQAVMPGMPPPPPSYDQAMYHPVAGPEYVPNHAAYGASAPPLQPYPPNANMYGPPQYSVPQYQYQHPPQYQQPHHYQQAIPSTVVIQNAYDPGARFDSTTRPHVPPPPPGIAPNLAQIAQANGHNLVLGQRSGLSSGGACLF